MAETAKEVCGSLSPKDGLRSEARCVRPKRHDSYHGTELDIYTSEGGYFWHDKPASILPPTAAEPSIPDPWNQKHTVTAAEPSEPKADGFDEWFGNTLPVYAEIIQTCRGRYGITPEMAKDHKETAMASWQYAYQAGEQSGKRKGMQMALEACKGERLESHDALIEALSERGGYGEAGQQDSDENYSQAVADCEAAILAAMEECQ